jgi:hypothetical protein
MTEIEEEPEMAVALKSGIPRAGQKFPALFGFVQWYDIGLL